ncbi:MAG: hypothetical protein KatS3mg115_1776 [Candidatus Poribacteria bacterium]|nr:MAG: hypothetical protein KatS3mg115_1776 [Candidatus Poribacteria bacterium]
MQNWVFGCDICQEACPWNRKAARSQEPDYRPRIGTVSPSLEELLSLSEEAFRERFQGTPLMRAKRSGLLRNAAVALGNSGDPSALPILKKALEDPEPLVRGHAAWAIGQIGGPEAQALLEAAQSQESDPSVLEEIQAALREIASRSAA